MVMALLTAMVGRFVPPANGTTRLLGASGMTFVGTVIYARRVNKGGVKRYTRNTDAEEMLVTERHLRMGYDFRPLLYLPGSTLVSCFGHRGYIHGHPCTFMVTVMANVMMIVTMLASMRNSQCGLGHRLRQWCWRAHYGNKWGYNGNDVALLKEMYGFISYQDRDVVGR